MTENQRTGFLQWACNHFGDFKVATRFQNGDWTQHWSVLKVWHNPKEFWRLDQANNRTLYPCEIVLDIDPVSSETPEQIAKRFYDIANTLIEEGYEFYAYHSGSRGFHIHLIFPDLVLEDESFRRELRKNFIKAFGCDMMKSSEQSMIALEFTPHWKTGKPKQLVMSNCTSPPEPLETVFMQNG